MSTQSDIPRPSSDEEDLSQQAAAAAATATASRTSLAATAAAGKNEAKDASGEDIDAIQLDLYRERLLSLEKQKSGILKRQDELDLDDENYDTRHSRLQRRIDALNQEIIDTKSSITSQRESMAAQHFLHHNTSNTSISSIASVASSSSSSSSTPHLTQPSFPPGKLMEKFRNLDPRHSDFPEKFRDFQEFVRLWCPHVEQQDAFAFQFFRTCLVPEKVHDYNLVHGAAWADCVIFIKSSFSHTEQYSDTARKYLNIKMDARNESVISFRARLTRLKVAAESPHAELRADVFGTDDSISDTVDFSLVDGYLVLEAFPDRLRADTRRLLTQQRASELKSRADELPDRLRRAIDLTSSASSSSTKRINHKFTKDEIFQLCKYYRSLNTPPTVEEIFLAAEAAWASHSDAHQYYGGGGQPPAGTSGGGNDNRGGSGSNRGNSGPSGRDRNNRHDRGGRRNSRGGSSSSSSSFTPLFCAHHGDCGHTSADCRVLQRQAEQARPAQHQQQHSQQHNQQNQQQPSISSDDFMHNMFKAFSRMASNGMSGSPSASVAASSATSRSASPARVNSSASSSSAAPTKSGPGGAKSSINIIGTDTDPDQSN